MKIGFSKDYGTIKFALDDKNAEEDLMNCARIEKMAQSEEWQILMTLFLKVKEKFDETVMKVKPSEQSFRENAIYSARLNGFWEAVSLPTKIIEASKLYKTKRLKELEEEHGVSKESEYSFNNE